jgi:hypothetical protein
MSDIKLCPICSQQMPYSERYPNSICGAHYNECIDSNGNHVTYENADEFGGLVSYHTIDNTIVRRIDDTCFVRGIKCFVEEARMGGIVIQVVPFVTR